MSDHVLLCLKCRQRGHKVEKCPLRHWVYELGWFFSPARSKIKVGTSWENTRNDICRRCKELDLIQLLENYPPWNTQMELDDDFEEQGQFVRSLGETGSVEFWTDCSVCCCLFAMTPQPSSEEQEIFLVPDWTISRLSGELGAVTMDTPEKRKYATCLLSVLKPSSLGMGTRVVGHRGDALCLLQEHLQEQRTLGGRCINVQSINTDMILGWVKACEDRHDASCRPVASKALEDVRLIEVNTRKVVAYPKHGCDYVAVSYVWGNVAQENYELGDTVATLPKTLEDALAFTQKLGKNYTWIDSVCIDQSNEEDKINQINRMWGIYQGAWITIITLSGKSADAGFPRFSRQEHHPQLVCHIDGKTLVGTMPTLSQQIWESPWGRRAWTLQEGLLSSRCLYISDHQIYYDCSSMQCSESLDESSSWAHGLSPASNPTEEGFVTWMLRQAGAGALRIPLDWPSRRLEHWGEKLNLYSYRSMTYPVDAIRAFQGVLQRLETIYPKGFFWGLPVEDFDWALTWASQRPPTRREGFPTWTWAGWIGPLFFGQPLDVKQTRRIPTYLEIEAVKTGQLWQIFAGRCDQPSEGLDMRILIINDPVHKATQVAPSGKDFQPNEHPTAEQKGYLFITAVCFRFTPDFSNPRTETYAAGQLETFLFAIRGKRCFIRIFSMDDYIPGKWVDGRWKMDSQRTKKDIFVLLARDHIDGFILHKLMLIDMKSSSIIAGRVTILELLVPLDDLDVLEEFSPRLQRIVLI